MKNQQRSIIFYSYAYNAYHESQIQINYWNIRKERFHVSTNLHRAFRQISKSQNDLTGSQKKLAIPISLEQIKMSHSFLDLLNNHDSNINKISSVCIKLPSNLFERLNFR